MHTNVCATVILYFAQYASQVRPFASLVRIGWLLLPRVVDNSVPFCSLREIGSRDSGSVAEMLEVASPHAYFAIHHVSQFPSFLETDNHYLTA